ncbi:MAG: hypothetical protein KDB53_01435 [Planctomycetes bacterium]|nr:hypothetical protein [Planctomycetota bacterium]
MKPLGFSLALALTLVLSASSTAQVGQALPTVELEDFSQTPAKSYDEFVGRVVLIEFFAYW